MLYILYIVVSNSTVVVNQYLNHPVLVIDDLNREFSGHDGGETF